MKVNVKYQKNLIEGSRAHKRPVITLVVDGRYYNGDINVHQNIGHKHVIEDLISQLKSINQTLSEPAFDAEEDEVIARDVIFSGGRDQTPEPPPPLPKKPELTQEEKDEALFEILAESVTEAVMKEIF